MPRLGTWVLAVEATLRLSAAVEALRKDMLVNGRKSKKRREDVLDVRTGDVVVGCRQPFGGDFYTRPRGQSQLLEMASNNSTQTAFTGSMS